MLEYNEPVENQGNLEKNQSSEEQMRTEGKVSNLGFTSSSQERMWMDQVRRECVRGYTNRIR